MCANGKKSAKTVPDFLLRMELVDQILKRDLLSEPITGDMKEFYSVKSLVKAVI